MYDLFNYIWLNKYFNKLLLLSASSQPPSTPQRKKAVINTAFEGDVSDPHSKIIANLTAVTEAKPEGTASGSSSSSGPPPVAQKKLGPQKIQSTPNFFVKKQAERKVLAKSVSVPNLIKKKSSKEEKKVM